MNDTFKLVLSLSLSGSILALLLFILKPFMKSRLSRSIQYYIWIVVLVRFLFPFSFEGSLMDNVFNQERAFFSSQAENMPLAGTAEERSGSFHIPKAEEKVVAGVNAADTDHSQYLQDQFIRYAIYIWLIGIFVSITLQAAGYIRFSTKLIFNLQIRPQA